MRVSGRRVLALAYALLTGAPGAVLAQSRAPDPALAHMLAAASYCAYTLNGQLADQGKRDARRCLNRVAGHGAWSRRLAGIGDADVEVYVAPPDNIDAYLLFRTGHAIVLAFRGTLAPPFLAGAGDTERSEHRKRALAEFQAFFLDWLNNVSGIDDDNGRYSSFDKSWQRLRTRLTRECRGQPGAGSDCGRFREFVAGSAKPHADGRLYITGHSKGGALATLATIDLPPTTGMSDRSVTYTFEAAKSLTAPFMANPVPAGARARLSAIWRFEYENDIIPLFPPDETTLPLFPIWLRRLVTLRFPISPAPFAPAGRLIFARPGAALATRPQEADLPRLARAIGALLDPASGTTAARTDSPIDVIAGFAALLVKGPEHACRQLVDNHFAIFGELAAINARMARGETGPIVTGQRERERTIFATGVRDAEGSILWGYRDWCDIFAGAGPTTRDRLARRATSPARRP